MIDWLRAARETPTVSLNGRDVPVAIRRLRRARRMTMRLAPDGSEVRISLPQWGRALDALVFATRRLGWLEDQLAKIPAAAPPAPGEAVHFRGRPLVIEWHARHPRRPHIAPDAVHLGGPVETMTGRLRRWLEAEATLLLEADLAEYCARAGVERPLLRLSRAQRRWGSCSGPRQGAHCIRINWRLVQAPDRVRRSVVAHEVAHLVHFDHSPAFHALLANLYEGDIGEADAWLRHHGRSLYSRFG